MKILHTADWHLGKRLENFSRLEEQKEVMEEICQIADQQKADAVIISGDLFDTFNPPTEAVDLFYKTLKKISNNGKRLVVAIAGNHDSPDRIDSPDPLARECGIVFIGYPNALVPQFELSSGLKVLSTDKGFVAFRLPGCDTPLRIIHTPYANEFRLKACLNSENEEEEMRQLLEVAWSGLSTKYCDKQGVNILMSHLFFTKQGTLIQEEPEDEKPILHIGGAQAVFSNNLPDNIQYVALGHLHRKQIVDQNPCPVVYSGSPLSYSFAESNQTKYVMVIDAEPGKEVVLTEVPLTKGKRLTRYRAKDLEDAISWLEKHQDELVELTLVSDRFITANDRKQLQNIHEGIISIIPEINNPDILEQKSSGLNLSKGIHELFNDYFLHAKGQLPNDRLTALFKEILAEEENK